MEAVIKPAIILVETQLPENLGAAARAMANFGFSDLRLVNPKVDPADPKAVAMAVGAGGILQKASLFQSLSEAVSDLTHVFGTTAMERQMIKRYYSPKGCMSLVQQRADWRVGFLFGPERTGLSNEDLCSCYGVIHIPVRPDFSSLNLGQALVILAYESYVSAIQATEGALHLGETKPASLQETQYLLSNLEQKLDKTHFWRTKDKKAVMWRNLRNIFTRMDLTEQEVRTLNGMFDALSQSEGR